MFTLSLYEKKKPHLLELCFPEDYTVYLIKAPTHQQ